MSTVSSSKSFASVTASYQYFFAIRFVQDSAVKLRFIPGAIWAAIIAASIGKVPQPQNGSTKIRSPFQGVSISSAAAKVSVIGALLERIRYPRLCKERPDVSIPTTASSFKKVMRKGYSAPSSGNQLIWYRAFKRSTTAFFTIDWISEGLNSLLFTDAAFATQNFASAGR